PRPPSGAWLKGIRAPNAATTDDPKEVPWAHFLKKRVKGVGIYEGGATFKKGVWRPAPSCAMNSAGARGFCPVCREATILVIYEHINPIDGHSPPTTKEVKAVEGGDAVLKVVPMRPRKRGLKVQWYVAQAAARTAVQGPEEEELETEAGDDERGFDTTEAGPYSFYPGGSRTSRDRSEYDEAPKGERSKLGKASGSRKDRTHVFPLGKLTPGRYWITAEVRDTTKWVLKDPKHLLEERVTWTVTVSPEP
ncbi:MAG: M64 family metallopeptidase, partial [Planctomycetota bacterium]